MSDGKLGKATGNKKETKENDKLRRETLAKYLYDLSKVTFTGLVIGSFATLFSKETVNIDYVIYTVTVGSATTLMFAWLGNRILK